MNRKSRLLVLVFGGLLLPFPGAAQELTGTLIGTVKDAQGAVVAGALVRIGSPALIGGNATLMTNQKGQLRFPALSPGSYELDVESRGFTPYHESGIRIGAAATVERLIVLRVAGHTESVNVEERPSHLEARDPGYSTRFGPEDLEKIPSRRASMFDLIRAAPGISPTSPGSGTVTTVSAFGSGTNENQFLIDGTNFTCPCNGIARAEPGIGFIHEVQVQSMGASAEFGNVQGAVINVITRQGGARFQYDASYFGQTAGLTSQPVRLALQAPATGQSGYTRARYRDFTTNLGGPVLRDRLWFFTGYEYLRDYDSQPGTDPKFPRTYEQNKVLAKLTWRLARGWQLTQSVHHEAWVSPEQPTLARPFPTTLRMTASVPAVTFGDLTHTSGNTVWEVRVGRFFYDQEQPPSTGDRTTASRFDNGTGITTGGPPQFGSLTLGRTTAKATVTHYMPGLFGLDHEWKVGTQVERGEHSSTSVIPGGVRFVDNRGQPFQSISADPSNTGGVFINTAVFASDALTVGGRLTINAGLRFDRNRAISQDLHALDHDGRATSTIIPGAGTLYVWNVLSPRLGVTAKLTSDGRTIARASYGRFSQGVLTGELASFHPGATAITTRDFVAAAADYTRIRAVVNPADLLLDRHTSAPRTDEYSVGLDREAGRNVAVAIAYIHKRGSDFIGWTDVAGRYVADTRPANGTVVPVLALDTSVTPVAARRFLLTNQDDYSLAYNGLVIAVEKRRSHGWQAFGSYTLSRAYGLQPSSGMPAAGAQVSTVAPPPGPAGITFGRDPNDLTNARGRLPNDRPHMLRARGSLDVPGTGFVLAANLGVFSGKPWAATAIVSVPQNTQQRIQLEPRGARRLSSQTLLDVRVSRAVSFGGSTRVELLLDVLNLLNDTAEEGLITDNVASPNFGRGNVFVDPRRAMFSVRVNLGR